MKKRLFILSLLLLAGGLGSDAAAQRLEKLEILQDNYPRAGYFRIAEFSIRWHYAGMEEKYDEWSRRMSDLSGIMGKTEYEELIVNNPHRQIYNWFRRFKEDYPEKLVMVHLNGRGRIPDYRLEKFSPGHWLYFEGANVLNALPDASSEAYKPEVWLEVDDPSHFRMDNGAKFNTPDDITLVRRREDGTFDWEHAEYVRLLNIRGNRIRVRRAMFNSTARAFEPGKTYAAPHVMGGPWEATTNMVWYYNLSTVCPRDAEGRSCADVLLEELSGNFAPGGRWETFDGVQFDVMMSIPTTGYHERRKALGQRADVDMDGRQDDGVVDGRQTYGPGCLDFLTRLRAAVGPDRILAADGREHGCQKAGNGVLSGVEMEGIPEQRPYGYITWSTVYNMLTHWKPLTATPKFNYGAFRYNTPEKLAPSDMLQYYHLGFALSTFTDSFLLCNSWFSLREIPDLREVFNIRKDEPVLGWLGRPLGPPRHLAAEAPDVLQGAGNPVSPRLLEETPDGIHLSATPENTYATARITESGTLEIRPTGTRDLCGFVLCKVPYINNEVYVEVTMRSTGEGSKEPQGYNRALVVAANNQRKRFMEQRSVVSDKWATHRFYFANTFDYMSQEKLIYNPKGEQRFNLRFMMQDADCPIEISRITVHSASEIVTRAFEHGLVVANLSNETYDCQANGKRLRIPAKDAAFIRTQNNVSK